MNKWSLTFIGILMVPLFGWAQFDEDESFDEDLTVDKEAAAPNEVTSKSTVSKDIDRSDIQKLAEAKKSRSESAILAAAARILSKDPNHPQTLNALGLFYFEARKNGMAKILFRRALKAHPNIAPLHNNLGIVYLSEGDTRLAVDSFKKSLQVKPGYETGAANLSSIYVRFRDYKSGLAPLEQVYEDVRSDVGRGQESAIELANNYGVALMGLGEQSKARKVFAEIFGSPSKNPLPVLNYAILLVEVQKEKKDAIRVISKLKFMTEDRDILRRVQELEKKLE